MKSNKIIIAGLCLAAMVSCQKENTILNSNKENFSFTVVNEFPQDENKAVIAENVPVFQAGDEISVFDGESNNVFTTAEGGANAVFNGTAASGAQRYVIVSPAKDSYSVTGSVVTYDIPDVQVATPGTADPAAIILAGRVLKLGDEVTLYNAVSYLKIVVPDGLSVKEIHIGGGKGSTMGIAGSFTINTGEQTIGIADVAKLKTTIKVIPQKGLSEIAAGTYYVAVRPGKRYDNGLAIAYVNEDNYLCKRTTSNAFNVDRGHIVPVGSLNTSDYPVAATGTAVLRMSGDEVQFTGRLKKIAGGAGTVAEENNNIEHIVFEAHTLYDGNFNNNNNVVSSGQGNTNIFAYMKGNTMYVRTEASKFILNASSNNLFRNFKALKSVTFNDVDTQASTTLERMFNGCTSLETVDFGNCDFSKVRDMQFMFQSIESLKVVRFGQTASATCSNFKGMFMDCKNITELNFGPNFTITHLADKTMCNNMFYNTAMTSNAAAGGDPTAKPRLYMSQAEYDQCRMDKGGVCANSALNAARFYFVPVI